MVISVPNNRIYKELITRFTTADSTAQLALINSIRADRVISKRPARKVRPASSQGKGSKRIAKKELKPLAAILKNINSMSATQRAALAAMLEDTTSEN